MKSLRISLIRLILSALFMAVMAFPLHAAPPSSTPAASSGDEQQFTSVIDDLPLMPGLRTEQDQDVLFVEPHAGRIAETTATGNVNIDEVYNFYRRSLPHLGWKVIDGRTYEREGERLFIDAHSDGNTATVQFSVKPAS